LKQFPKLQYFIIHDTKIEYLEKDLFIHNPEITTIRMHYNHDLRNIHPEITLPLKKLSSTIFVDNHASCTAITTCYDRFWLELQESLFALSSLQKRFDSLLMRLMDLEKKDIQKTKKRLQIDLTCRDKNSVSCHAIDLTIFESDAHIKNVKAADRSAVEKKHVTEFIINAQDVAFLPINIAKTFPKLVSLSVINSNLITINEGALNDLNHVKFINMSSNRIKEISTKDFLGVPNIAKLDLSRNQIAVIQSGAFKTNKGLVELNLSLNQLTDLNVKAFNQLLKLQTFNLQSNKLEIIDSQLFDTLKALKLVDLRDNICIDADYPTNKKTINELKQEITDKCTTPIRFCCDLITPSYDNDEEESETICR